MKRATLATFDIMVGNFNSSLKNDVVEKKVYKQFVQYGETKGMFVKENNYGKYVVIRYLSEPDADRAVAESNGMMVEGTLLTVKRMDNKRLSKPGGGGAMSGGGKDGGSHKNSFSKNPDIVPTVEPVGSSSPGPEAEPNDSSSTGSCSYRNNQLKPMVMHVSHIDTPTLFWCVEANDVALSEQSDMGVKLLEVCLAAPKVTALDINKIYGARFSEDGLWYRAQIKQIYGDDKVKVQYVDFGNSEDTNVKELVELPAELAAVKPISSKVILHQVAYVKEKSKEALKYLREITENRFITVSPTFRTPDGSGIFAQVYVGSTCLNQELLDRGYASKKAKIENKSQQPQHQQQQLHQQQTEASPVTFHIGDGGGYSSGNSSLAFGGLGVGPSGVDDVGGVLRARRGGVFGQQGEGFGRQVLGSDADRSRSLGGPRFAAPQRIIGGGGHPTPLLGATPLHVGGSHPIPLHVGGSHPTPLPPKPVHGGGSHPTPLLGGGGGFVEKSPLLPEPLRMVLPQQPPTAPNYSDLKIDLQNKERALEKERAELASLRNQLKTMHQDLKIVTARLEDSNIEQHIKVAVGLVEKVCKLRSQFSDEMPTALDQAIELIISSDRLTENSITSLPQLMTTLSSYRTLQNDICQIKSKEELKEDQLEERNTIRKTLYQQLTSCIDEMEALPFTQHAHNMSECTEKLLSSYENFFNKPAERCTDLSTAVATYLEFKANKQREFEQTRLQTDQQLLVVQSVFSTLGQSLSLTVNMESKPDFSLLHQLKVYCSCLQMEINAKSVETNPEGSLVASLVQALHRELKTQILCLNDLIRYQIEFRNLRSSTEPWLDKKPSVDKLLETRQLLRALKSRLRHKLADKHDAEESDDRGELEKIQEELAELQKEIHVCLLEEEKELAELAVLADSHFPELFLLYSDCGLEAQLKYKGLVKSNREVNHYHLTPVMGASSQLFFSKFADEDVIVMECLLSDGHHLGREDFLVQLLNYTSIHHPSILHPTAVFFDKNNRHAYLQFRRGDGDILAHFVEYGPRDHIKDHLIVKSVAEGLMALHSKKVLHGEINPYSILRFLEGSAALLPPDLSCLPLDRAKNKFTTTHGMSFMAPEVSSMPAKSEPTGVIDMFSVGILILYLSSPNRSSKHGPDGSVDLSEFFIEAAACNLVRSLTSLVPQLRPTAEMLLQTQFVTRQESDSPARGVAVTSPALPPPASRASPTMAPPSSRASPTMAPPTSRASPTMAPPSSRASPTMAPPSSRASPTMAPPTSRASPTMAPPCSRASPVVASPTFSDSPPPPNMSSFSMPNTQLPPPVMSVPSELPAAVRTLPPQQPSTPTTMPFCQIPPPLHSFFMPPPSDSYPSVSMDEDQTFGEFNTRQHVSSQHAEGFHDTDICGFQPTFGAGATPSGFEEAALQQEQEENESRGGAGAQFLDQLYVPAGPEGDFEIGTFSIDDVNGAGGDPSSSFSKGRKITGNQGSENGGDDTDEEGWPVGEQTEHSHGW